MLLLDKGIEWRYTESRCGDNLRSESLSLVYDMDLDWRFCFEESDLITRYPLCTGDIR